VQLLFRMSMRQDISFMESCHLSKFTGGVTLDLK
jgi:hypothetical protein